MTSVVSPSNTINSASSNKTKTPRQIGYDVARALAVIGMVIVNYKVAMGAEKSGPEWLLHLTGLLEGRAAAAFVILAGAGISLLSRRAREQDDAQALTAHRKTLLKRAAFLYCFGLIFASVWPADILHFYGIYFVVGALLVNVSGRILWYAAIEITFCFVLFLFLFDYDKGWNWEALDYEGFWTLTGMLRHLLFNGFHPVIPWVVFLLVGIGLGRQDLTNKVLRRKIAAWGLGALVLSETISHYLTEWALARYPDANPEDVIALCGTEMMPPMPLYIISAGGSSLVVIMLCFFVTEKFASFPGLFEPFIAIGRLALTLYVAHIVIGLGLLEVVIGPLNDMSITLSILSALCFTFAAMVFAVIWRRFFKQGPLEWLMRTITR